MHSAMPLGLVTSWQLPPHHAGCMCRSPRHVKPWASGTKVPEGAQAGEPCQELGLGFGLRQ